MGHDADAAKGVHSAAVAADAQRLSKEVVWRSPLDYQQAVWGKGKQSGRKKCEWMWLQQWQLQL